jgi:tetratricopeptide (TPR) repeat protein
MLEPAAADRVRRSSASIRASSSSCHHSLLRPQILRDVLDAELAEHGSAAAVARYRALRTEYYGSDAYDFSESALPAFARRLVASNQSDRALQFFRLNLEFYPESAETYLTLAEILLKQGDLDQARANYKEVLKRDPSNAFVLQRLQQIDTSGKPPQ